MAAINAQFTSRICQTLRGQDQASLHIRFDLVRGCKPWYLKLFLRNPIETEMHSLKSENFGLAGVSAKKQRNSTFRKGYFPLSSRNINES